MMIPFWRASFPTAVLICLTAFHTVAADAPPGATEVNILVVGDIGYSPDPKVSPNTRAVAKAMADYVSGHSTRFDAVVVPGDSFKIKLTSTEDEAFRKGFEEMYDPKVLTMPFYAILGNHDYDAPASAVELKYSARHPESRWKMPARWYRVDLPAEAPLVTLLMLDSNKDKMTSAEWKTQIKWLGDELAKPHDTWMVCCGHKPLFSDGAHGDSGTTQKEFGPLLKKHNVDFYLSGHDHVLEHMQPEGWKTTFIVSGGGGENTVRSVPGHRGQFLKAMPGFVHLQLTPNYTKAFFIDTKAAPVYSFRRDLNGHVNP